jgi:hypothetical protein
LQLLERFRRKLLGIGVRSEIGLWIDDDVRHGREKDCVFDPSGVCG